MQALLEFAPLAAFLVAYYLGGVYVATAVLMVGMAVLLIVDYAIHRRIPAMHSLSAVLVWIFGSATLVLHNQRFIQWKPTVFFWLAAAAFLGSFWVGKRTLAEQLMGPAMEAQIPRSAWRRLNVAWVVFSVFMGALNLVVMFGFSERVWVNVHTFGFIALTLAFAMGQAVWIYKRAEGAQGPREAST